MSAYAILDVEIQDIAKYLQYQKLLAPLLEAASARYLARGGEFQVFEGDYRPERLMLIEFPSLDVLQDFYGSAAVQALEPQRDACTRSCIIAVNGLPEPQDP